VISQTSLDRPCSTAAIAQDLEWWVNNTNVECAELLARAATRLRALEQEVDQLNLAEEGAKEAFGVVVDSNQELREKNKGLRACIESQQRVIVALRNGEKF